MASKRKQTRNPKPIQRSPGPVTNRRVANKPYKPARSGAFQRGTTNAEQDHGDLVEAPSAFDDPGPEDVSGFDA